MTFREIYGYFPSNVPNTESALPECELRVLRVQQVGVCECVGLAERDADKNSAGTGRGCVPPGSLCMFLVSSSVCVGICTSKCVCTLTTDAVCLCQCHLSAQRCGWITAVTGHMSDCLPVTEAKETNRLLVSQSSQVNLPGPVSSSLQVYLQLCHCSKHLFSASVISSALGGITTVGIIFVNFYWMCKINTFSVQF